MYFILTALCFHIGACATFEMPYSSRNYGGEAFVRIPTKSSLSCCCLCEFSSIWHAVCTTPVALLPYCIAIWLAVYRCLFCSSYCGWVCVLNGLAHSLLVDYKPMVAYRIWEGFHRSVPSFEVIELQVSGHSLHHPSWLDDSCPCFVDEMSVPIFKINVIAYFNMQIGGWIENDRYELVILILDWSLIASKT